MTVFNSLNVSTIPLFGTHLIEASAGTGKTFNITRIYLRMLIEKKLSVQQILVMTFTTAATEELKGRILKEIQDALTKWGSFEEKDGFFFEMQSRYSRNDVYPILYNALLHMDESSIFTIHGFCNRVLSNMAFESGLEFNLNMEADTQDIEVESIRDHYRFLSKTNAVNYNNLTSKWETPESFYTAFRSVLSTDQMLSCVDEETLIADHNALRNSALNELMNNKDALFDALVNTHKDKQKRIAEWDALIDWLSNEEAMYIPKLAKDFLNGGRYRKAENKALVVDAMTCKNEADSLLKSIDDGKVFALAKESIIVIREEIKAVKYRQQLMNFDDLITTLADALSSDTDGTLAQEIRTNYPVALVDEFQDTDPKQYGILKAVFDGHCTSYKGHALFMIGDPKQAIYGFRGGDIFAYLDARHNAGDNWIMDTNWRSSSEMIEGYNRLFYGDSLPEKDSLVGSDKVFNYGIEYVPVKSGGKADACALSDTQGKALNFNYFPVNEDYLPSRGDKQFNRAEFGNVISQWCAGEVSRLLTDNVMLGDKPLIESDIAILVRTGAEAKAIESALSAMGLASVYLSNKENLFDSVQAHDLYTTLNGILHLDDNSKMLSALSTRYLGGKSALFKAMQEDEAVFEAEQDYLRELRALWETKSFMAMAMHFVHTSYTPEADQHERALTNTIHLLELLQQASTRFKQPLQLVRYLRDQIAIATRKQESELRLESDANLIKIVTQHGSKGLEYPIVFLPFTSKYSDPTRFGKQLLDIHNYHDQDNNLIKLLGHDEAGLKAATDEGVAESIRLLYVAVTRAIHRCYVCVTPFENSETSPIGKTLGSATHEDLLDDLLALENSAPNAISVNQVTELEFDEAIMIKEVDSTVYTPSVFSGHIENDWYLSSFSSITKNVHTHHTHQTEHNDDNGSPLVSLNKSQEVRFKLRKGAKTGNFLHDVFERINFTSPDYALSCRTALFSYGSLPQGIEESDLFAWFDELLNVPLPALYNEDNFALSDIEDNKVLKEVEFYFPLENVNAAKLSGLLSKHRGGDNNAQLPTAEELKGMMHGFIDLVFEQGGKFYIADYKSTFLGDTLADYSNVAMASDVSSRYYDLQYLIYSVALHRFLKSKKPDYNPKQHFGGVYYLYLRGMSTGAQNGIYSKTIDSEFINELDAVMSGS